MTKKIVLISVFFIICSGIIAIPSPANGKENSNKSIKESFLSLFKRDDKSDSSKKEQKSVLREGTFGAYQRYTPFIKDLIKYTKTHTISGANYQQISVDVKALAKKHNVPVNKVSIPRCSRNTIFILLSNSYYFKLLQNIVASYSSKTNYHIDFSPSGRATCVGKNQMGYASCQKLGGTNPVSVNRIPSWKAYRLEQNIFDD